MNNVGIVLEKEVMSRFVSECISDWSCSASSTYGLPFGPSSFIFSYSPTLDVSCHVSVMCCVAPFCDVL
jgi:hypothetical protein